VTPSGTAKKGSDQPTTPRGYAERADQNYAFFYVEGKRLYRRGREGKGHLERMVDGEWVRWGKADAPKRARKRSRADDDDDGHGLDTGEIDGGEVDGNGDEGVAKQESGEGHSTNSDEPLTVGRMARLARKYVIADRLDEKRVTGPWQWARHHRPWLSIAPPLNGGAPRRVSPEAANCSREAYFDLLSKLKASGDEREKAFEQLREQAELGDQRQRDRGTGVETRSSYFAGAAGLTTTLVLANAGLLLGQDKLDSPLRWMAGAALLVASFCAVMTGLRALQASMVTFVRCPANSVSRIVARRRSPHMASLECRYIAALLLSQNRNSVVGDWKITRLQEARGWFAVVIAGVVVVTVMVLIQAIFLS
jgi:hypothetical protein